MVTQGTLFLFSLLCPHWDQLTDRLFSSVQRAAPTLFCVSRYWRACVAGFVQRGALRRNFLCTLYWLRRSLDYFTGMFGHSWTIVSFSAPQPRSMLSMLTQVCCSGVTKWTV